MNNVQIIIIPKHDRIVVAIRFEEDEPSPNIKYKVMKLLHEFCEQNEVTFTTVTERKGISYEHFKQICEDIAQNGEH
jgi:hypothetical protein